MPHHVRVDGSDYPFDAAGRSPAPASGAPPRTGDDWPPVSGGLPVRTPGPTPPLRRPQERPATPDPAATVTTAGVERLRAFTDAIVNLHQVTAGRSGFIPMCRCGSPARHCEVIRAEHELLGVPMPFTFGPPRPPYFEV